MAPPPRLLHFLLFLSVLLLLPVSGRAHGTRHQLQLGDDDGEHRVAWIGEMHHAVVRWWWTSRTVVVRRGGGGHGHGRGRGHGPPGTPAVFYPRTVTGGHHRRSAATATGRRPSARALLVAAAVVVLLLRL